MNKRPDGFYWVYFEGEWQPAKWDGVFWYVIAFDCPLDDEAIDQIGEACQREA